MKGMIKIVLKLIDLYDDNRINLELIKQQKEEIKELNSKNYHLSKQIQEMHFEIGNLKSKIEVKNV